MYCQRYGKKSQTRTYYLQHSLQELYGEKTERPRPGTTSEDENEVEDDTSRSDTNNNTTDNDEATPDEDEDDEELCNDASVDAMVTVKDKTTYTFKVLTKNCKM